MGRWQGEPVWRLVCLHGFCHRLFEVDERGIAETTQQRLEGLFFESV
jgi:hypothetical protein